jgi:Ca2+-binding RTX toxin-like protein
VADVFVGTGGGNDHVDASAVSSWMVVAMLGLGNDTYLGGAHVDGVQGGPGHDTLSGNDGADRLYGMTGNDTVNGGAGNDLLSVGPGLGAQLLAAGAGSDAILIEGTRFSDQILVWDTDANEAAAGSSLRALVSSPVDPPAGAAAATILDLTVSGVEAADRLFVGGGAGDDRIRLANLNVVASRVSQPSRIAGGPGADEIFDGLGPDTIVADQFTSPNPSAGDGDDLINTQDGANHDVVYGGGGTNTCTTDSADAKSNCP